MQKRRGGTATGQDEGFERRETRLDFVDERLEASRVAGRDERKLQPILLARHATELGTDREEVPLDFGQPLGERSGWKVGRGDSHARVELVDRPVGFDARVVLRNASSPEESRRSLVAGAGVD